MKQEKFKTYKFNSLVWKYKGAAGWHFVTLPKPLTKKIRNIHKSSEEGWGRLPALAKTGKSTWKSAIWFDTKLKSYLLPIKSEIRKKEKIERDIKVDIEITIKLGHQRLLAWDKLKKGE